MRIVKWTILLSKKKGGNQNAYYKRIRTISGAYYMRYTTVVAQAQACLYSRAVYTQTKKNQKMPQPSLSFVLQSHNSVTR